MGGSVRRAAHGRDAPGFEDEEVALKLLVANRGEIAIRVLHAARDLGWPTVAVSPEDDAGSLHLRRADEALRLPGAGAAAYLDSTALIAAARDCGAQAVHPGYGFLSESAEFAQACEEAGLVFVGPGPEALEIFGDKAKALALADECGVPTLERTHGETSLDAAKELLASLGGDAALMVKALAGGGGRGMRVARNVGELEEAFARCASEAEAAFGRGDLYVERFVPHARHLEIQVAGDHTGAVIHLGERECTLQRRHQKLVEIAPSPNLSTDLRDALCQAALQMAGKVHYTSLGTFEFLLDAVSGDFFFLETNARLQVEHTVTEEVTGVDLVQAQLRMANGSSLADLGLTQAAISQPRGFAVQARINLETLGADGSVRPSGGTLGVYEPPSGAGIRVDGYGYAGYTTNPRFDSLLAKVVAWSSGEFSDALRKAERAVSEFRIEGVATNLPFLSALLQHPAVASHQITTAFLEENSADLAAAASASARALSQTTGSVSVGAKLGTTDPLAILDHGRSGTPSSSSAPATPALPNAAAAPPGAVAIPAPLQGTLVSLLVEVGAEVGLGQPLLVMEAMKMEHVDSGGVQRHRACAWPVAAGDTVFEGQPLIFLEEAEVVGEAAEVAAEIDLDRIRPDLQEVFERHSFGQDESRPDAVARRQQDWPAHGA